MRKEHKLERQFNDWKNAGYGNQNLSTHQLIEIKRAFMGGIFEGLNFVIEQVNNPQAEKEIQEAYEFLRGFHKNEVSMHNKSPFGKKFY